MGKRFDQPSAKLRQNTSFSIEKKTEPILVVYKSNHRGNGSCASEQQAEE